MQSNSRSCRTSELYNKVSCEHNRVFSYLGNLLPPLIQWIHWIQQKDKASIIFIVLWEFNFFLSEQRVLCNMPMDRLFLTPTSNTSCVLYNFDLVEFSEFGEFSENIQIAKTGIFSTKFWNSDEISVAHHNLPIHKIATNYNSKLKPNFHKD